MCSCKTTRGFLKAENKSRIYYQCIMSGINKLFFYSAPFNIKNKYKAYDELE